MKNTETVLIEQFFTEYLLHLARIGKSSQAIAGSKQRVRMLVRFVKDTGLVFLGIAEAQRYASFLQEKDRSPRTVHCYLQAAVSFYDYLREKSMVQVNPFRSLKKPRLSVSFPRNVLKEREMDEFLETLKDLSCEKTTRTQADRYRVSVIAELLYATGMRISEASALTPDDIDFGRSLVTIKQGKGGASRVAYLNEYCLEILRIYLEELRPFILNDTHDKSLLFGTKWNGLSQFVNKKLAELPGFGSVTSHSFRHAVGYHLLRSGCQVRYIQEILGHKSLRSTEVYTKIDKGDLKNILDSHHPRIFK